MKVDASVPHLFERRIQPAAAVPRQPVKQEQEAEQVYPFSKEEILGTVGQLNKTTEALNIGFRFKFHEGADRYMLQIVDIITNEVIKEIPPQKLLDLAASIREMIGLLLDEKM